jgi:hypothetical protein
MQAAKELPSRTRRRIEPIWLTMERRLVHGIGPTTPRGLRDHAMVVVLLRCAATGRGAATVHPATGEALVIVDLVGKGATSGPSDAGVGEDRRGRLDQDSWPDARARLSGD